MFNNRYLAFTVSLVFVYTALPMVPAYGQQTGDSNSTLEEVRVTGTRLRMKNGMETPTPVTSVNMTEIGELDPGNIINAVTQMPQFLNNDTPSSAGSAVGPLGAAGVNLRGIGSNRTLVLLDGRRVPPFNRLGTPDISTFPQSMISGMEVVTGGASAAYGSDAVSGVVNFILDKKYNGLKGKVQGGITQRNDYNNYEFSLSGGHDLGENTHFIASIDYYNSDPVYGTKAYADRSWFNNWGAVDVNGSGQPRVVAKNVHSREYTAGGLIILPGSALNMTYFTEGGVPAKFQNGTLVGATSQAGGTGFLGKIGSLQQEGGLPGLAPGVERGSAFLYVNHDFNQDWNAYFQYMFGKNKIKLHDNTGRMYSVWGATIYRDNAFLPASIAAVMDAEGLTSFPLKRYASSADLGKASRIQDNDMNAFTVGFEGKINDIRLHGYYQYGKVVSVFTAKNYTRTDRMYRALDTVVDPVSGEIVCRSTLTFPNDGCVPANPFGPGTMSQEAIDYILGTMWRKSTVQQHVAELIADTEIFNGWQAGAVSLAGGISYRNESFDQYAGPAGLVAVDTPSAASQGYMGMPGSFVGDNILQFGLGGEDVRIGGGYDVTEVFGETLIPLLRDRSFAKAIDLNGALRYANYSGSGGVLAWKAGLDWRINDSFRVRATRSRDTRAATLRERYDQSGGGSTINDPQLGGIRYVISQLSGGNPNVQPELSDTWTAGVVFTPTFGFLNGFNLSVDWYDIKIQGYIAQLGTQKVVDDCYAGATSLCALITRDSSTNMITLVQNFFLNVAQARATGVDIEASYRTPLSLLTDGNEELNVRVFASYLMENSFTNAGAPKQDDAGDVTHPNWTLTALINYSNGPFSASLTGRYIDSTVQYTEPTTSQVLDINSVDSMFTTNLRLNYDFNTNKLGSYTVFFNVSNLFDVDPPIIPTFSGFFGAQTSNPNIFDVLGRRFTAGVKFEF